MAYAETTGVPVERSKSEIEKVLSTYGAQRFAYMIEEKGALIAFKANNRNIRFILPYPDISDFNQTPTGRNRKSSSVPSAYEQEIRRRWRALSLVIKAKLEAVQTGISEFEDEFLANIVLPNGQTVSEQTRPSIKIAYENNDNIKLLPEY